MKKTSLIILTIVASLSVSISSAQSSTQSKPYQPDYLYESDNNKTGYLSYDTIKRNNRDTIRDVYYPQQQISYNYYYQSRFFNSLYRIFLPGRYYQVIHRPGFVPRHVRREGGVMHARGTAKRGGFGRSGRSHTQSN